MRKLVFGISGASGMPLARTALALFSQITDLEIHLIVSGTASIIIEKELGGGDLRKFAAIHYGADNLAAPPASGSWPHSGMLICPCSMRSLACIANGCGSNLIHRAADVALKERRKLVLVTRESPLNLVHLRNMTAITEAGAIVMPFSPAFYSCGESLELAMKHFAGRLLDQFGIENLFCERWQGLK